MANANATVTPTLWRLGVRVWWGGVNVLEVPDCSFPEDALEVFEASHGNCQRVVKAEFWCHHDRAWKQIEPRNLYGAIALVRGAKV